MLARTRRGWLAALLGVAAVVPMLLALGTNTPLYRPIRDVVPGLHYPRVPERLMPIACLAIAALVAFAVGTGFLETARLLPVRPGGGVSRLVAVGASPWSSSRPTCTSTH